jgi:hypothetical protein
VFLADVEHCIRCDGRMRWVEAASAPEAIARLLAKHRLLGVFAGDAVFENARGARTWLGRVRFVPADD